uniref:Uncharacterized protein n=1 Tax=Rhabditophanes sp. KR3021 TaxID=114890 RepID=A0AC35U5T4_9BILA
MQKLTCLALIAVVGVSMAAEPGVNKEEKIQTAANYGGGPQFPQPPFYGGGMMPMPPFMFPPRHHHHSDLYYCTVQATFPLAYKTYGAAADAPIGGYGQGDVSGNQYSNGGSAQAHPKFDVVRQSCRYSATTSFTACNNCCQIASHHLSTSTDEIHGALFYFSPNAPINNQSPAVGYGAAPADDVDAGPKFVQCVCCAPRRF